jgi:hypothetical protein
MATIAKLARVCQNLPHSTISVCLQMYRLNPSAKTQLFTIDQAP